mmetsp:Transcript_14693/g.42022  ORF Transcript_14693/g.42022 Transcript_14693/m.42022 type:complete len:81 (-) Transcript_14693:585-827(-)
MCVQDSSERDASEGAAGAAEGSIAGAGCVFFVEAPGCAACDDDAGVSAGPSAGADDAAGVSLLAVTVTAPWTLHVPKWAA